EELAKFLTAEHGKVLSDAKGEVARGLEVIEFCCGIPELLKGGYSEQASTGIDVYSIRQPLGVVAGITPFNFPAMVPMWMWAPALASGNTFVLKPSEKDPSASLYTAQLLQEAGVPDGVFNVVHGDEVAGDAGDRLVAAIKDRLPKIKVGNGLEPDVEMGPLVTREHRDKVAGYIDGAREQGADVVADGRETAPDGGGFFLGVSLLDNVTPEMDAYKDEIFGPVLGATPVSTYSDAG